MSRWWRAYAEARNDPKIQGLPLEMFRAWFNLCCLAVDRDGKIPSILDAAMAMHVPESKAKAAVAFLAGKGLLDAVPGGYFEPHNWKGRQYKTDVTDPTNATRQKRWRNANRNGDRNGDNTVMHNAAEPLPPNDQIQNTDTEREIPIGISRKRARPKGEMPADFVLRPEDLAFATERGWPEAKIQSEFSRFCDHAQATGRRQVDWRAAWRNWVTSPYSNGTNGDKNGHTSPASGRKTMLDVFSDIASELAEKRRA